MTIIILNVGGTRMQTYKSTLEKLEYFSSKLNRWNDKSESELFIDYDPTLFIHLLNKLRDDKYELPNDENIVSMCNYFGYPIVTIEEFEVDDIIKPYNGFVRRLDPNYYGNQGFYEIEPGQKIIAFCIKIYGVNSKYDPEGDKMSIDYVVIQNKNIIWKITIDSIEIYFKKIIDNMWKLRKDFLNIIQKNNNKINIKIYGGECNHDRDIHIIVEENIV